MPLSTEVYTLIVTGALGGIGYLVKRVFDKKTKDAELSTARAVEAQTKIVTEKLHLELNEKIMQGLRDEITRFYEDKKVDQKAKLDLIEINKNLIGANELLRREVGELKKEVHELRLELIKANLIPTVINPL